MCIPCASGGTTFGSTGWFPRARMAEANPPCAGTPARPSGARTPERRPRPPASRTRTASGPPHRITCDCVRRFPAADVAQGSVGVEASDPGGVVGSIVRVLGVLYHRPNGFAHLASRRPRTPGGVAGQAMAVPKIAGTPPMRPLRRSAIGARELAGEVFRSVGRGCPPVQRPPTEIDVADGIRRGGTCGGWKPALGMPAI